MVCPAPPLAGSLYADSRSAGPRPEGVAFGVTPSAFTFSDTLVTFSAWHAASPAAGASQTRVHGACPAAGAAPALVAAATPDMPSTAAPARERTARRPVG